MKSLIATALFFLIAPGVSSAQSTQNSAIQDLAQGYLFFGMGVLSEAPAHYGIFHTGGGADFRVFKGLGVDSEVGVMGRPGDGVGLFSIGPSYHFLGAPHKSRLDPFVDGGYTRTFGQHGFTSSGNLFNFGGGINYWFFKRVALRVDFRDYVDPYFRRTPHYPAVRIGIVLR